jgi:hypothetical protein
MNTAIAMLDGDPSRHTRMEIEDHTAARDRALANASNMREVETKARSHAEQFERIAQGHALALMNLGVKPEDA